MLPDCGFFRAGRVFLSKLSVVVMDEVDVLMGKGFETEMADLLDALKVCISGTSRARAVLHTAHCLNGGAY